MNLLKLTAMGLVALLFTAASWSSDTAITQVWLNVDPSYRLRLPDTIVLQNTGAVQQYNQVCVGITGVPVSGNVGYQISVASTHYDAIAGEHRLSDGSASPNYIGYRMYWGQLSAEITNAPLTGLTLPSANANQNYADIVNDTDCSSAIALLFDLDDADLATASGAYTDNVTITLSSN